MKTGVLLFEALRATAAALAQLAPAELPKVFVAIAAGLDAVVKRVEHYEAKEHESSERQWGRMNEIEARLEKLEKGSKR